MKIISRRTFVALLCGLAILAVVFLYLYRNTFIPFFIVDGAKVESVQDNFARNQECLSMKDKIVQQLTEKISPFGEASLEQIFYSPKINSCVYVEYTIEHGFYNKRLFDIRNDSHSSEPLAMCTAVYSSTETEEVFRKNNDLSYYERLLSGCDAFKVTLDTYK